MNIDMFIGWVVRMYSTMYVKSFVAICGIVTIIMIFSSMLGFNMDEFIENHKIIGTIIAGMVFIGVINALIMGICR